MPPSARPGVRLAGTRGARLHRVRDLRRDSVRLALPRVPGAGCARREARRPAPPARAGSGRRRTCNPPVKSRELCLLSYGAGTEGEGVEPPSPCEPPVFETGYRAGGSPSSRAGRVGSRPKAMWPAGIEPAAPRVSGGRSTGLSYGHGRRAHRPPSISPAGEIDAVARGRPSSVASVRSTALFSMPLAHPSTLDRRPPAAQARRVAVLRGGALEPDPQSVLENCTGNTSSYLRAYFRANA